MLTLLGGKLWRKPSILKQIFNRLVFFNLLCVFFHLLLQGLGSPLFSILEVLVCSVSCFSVSSLAVLLSDKYVSKNMGSSPNLGTQISSE